MASLRLIEDQTYGYISRLVAGQAIIASCARQSIKHHGNIAVSSIQQVKSSCLQLVRADMYGVM